VKDNMDNYGKTRDCTEYNDEFSKVKGRDLDKRADKWGFTVRILRSKSDSPKRRNKPVKF
jgi:hypothetical protein